LPIGQSLGELCRGLGGTFMGLLGSHSSLRTDQRASSTYRTITSQQVRTSMLATTCILVSKLATARVFCRLRATTTRYSRPLVLIFVPPFSRQILFSPEMQVSLPTQPPRITLRSAETRRRNGTPLEAKTFGALLVVEGQHLRFLTNELL